MFMIQAIFLKTSNPANFGTLICVIFGQKYVGAVSKNVFSKNRPYGGARRGPCDKSEAEVVIGHPRSVCAKLGMDRSNCSGDEGRAKK